MQQESKLSTAFKQLKKNFLGVFKTPLRSNFIGNSRTKAVAIRVIIELQIISFFFLDEHVTVWKSTTLYHFLNKLLRWVNFCMLVPRQSLMVQIVASSLLFITSSVPVIAFFVKATLTRERESTYNFLFYSENFLIFLLFFWNDVFRFNSIGQIATGFACVSGTEQLFFNPELKCVKSNQAIGQIVIFFLAYLMEISVVKVNYERRIFLNFYGTKRGNEDEVTCTTIICVMMASCLFFIDVEEMYAIIGGVLLFIRFTVKANSDLYICLDFKRVDIGLSAISFLASLAFFVKVVRTDSLTFKFLDEFSDCIYLIVLSMVIVLISILIKSGQEAQDEIMRNPIRRIETPQGCLAKLDTVLWRFSRSIKKQDGAQIEEIISAISCDFEKDKGNEAEDNLIDTYGKMSLSSMKSMRKSEFGQNVKDLIEKRHLILDYLINEHKRSIKRFPGNMDLKISLIYLLVDFTSSKNIALYHLNYLNTLKFNINRGVLILRLNSLIKTKASNANGKHFHRSYSFKKKFDEVKIIEVNQQMNKILEEASSSYSLFWQNLEDAKPDIQKVHQSLKKSMDKFSLMDHFYNSNPILDGLNLSSKKNYGLFSKFILNQEKKGGKILENYSLVYSKNTVLKKDIANLYGRDKVNDLAEPILILAREFGIRMKIKNCNKYFAKLLGYQKNDIVNCSLEKIFQRKSLKFYFRKLTYGSPEKMERLSLVFRKRNGMRKVFSVEVKNYHVSTETSYLILKVNIKKQGLIKAELLVNPEGKIIYFGEFVGLISGFGTPRLKKKYGISMIEDFSKDLKDFRGFEEVSFFESSTIKINITERELRYFVFKLDCCFLFCIQIWREQIDPYFDLKSNKVKTLSIKKTIRVDQPESGEEFQFQVTRNLEYEGKFRQRDKPQSFTLYKNLRVTSGRKNLRCSTTIIDKIIERTLLEKVMSEDKIDYADGIITKRLTNGYLREVDDSIESFEGTEESEKRKVQEHARRISVFASSKLIQKSILGKIKKQISIDRQEIEKQKFEYKMKKFTKSQKMPYTLKSFLYATTFVMLTMISLKQFKFTRILEVMSQIKLHQQIDYEKNLEYIYLINTANRFYNIALLQRNFEVAYGFSKEFNYSQYLDNMVINLEDWLEDYERIHRKSFQIYSKMLNSEGLIDIYGKRSIVLKIGRVTRVMSMNEASKTFASVGFKGLFRGPERMGFRQQDTKFVVQNGLNSILIGTERVTREIEKSREMLLTWIEDFNGLTFVSSLTLNLVPILLLSFMIYRIVKYKEKTIQLFYGFSDDKVREMVRKTSNFVSLMQDIFVDESNDILPNESFLAKAKQKKVEFGFSSKNNFITLRKKKKIKGSLFSIWSCPILVVVTLFTANFSNSLVHNSDQRLNLITSVEVSDTIQKIGDCWSSYGILISGLTMAMVNNNETIEDSSALELINRQVGRVEHDQEELFLRIWLHRNEDPTFNSNYVNLISGDLCEKISGYEEKKDIEFQVDCEIFKGKLESLEFGSSMSKLLNDLKKITERVNFLSNFEENERYPFEGDCQQVNLNVRSNPRYQSKHLLCLLQSELFFKSKLFFDNIVTPVMKKLSFTAVTSSNESILETEQAEISHNIPHSILTVAFWLLSFVFVSHLNAQIYRIRKMLDYHPIEALKMNSFLNSKFN